MRGISVCVSRSITSSKQNYRYLKVSPCGAVEKKKLAELARFSGTLPAAIIGADRSRIYLWTYMLYTPLAFSLAWFQSDRRFHLLVLGDHAKKNHTLSRLSLRIILRGFNFNISRPNCDRSGNAPSSKRETIDRSPTIVPYLARESPFDPYIYRTILRDVLNAIV